MSTLILICGLPGAGKTTLAKKLESARQAVRFCPDDWIKAVIKDPSDKAELDRLRDPVEAFQWNLATRLLTQGQTVILENGFWTKLERAKFRSLGRALGARVELHFLDVPKEELWQRIADRNTSPSNDSFPITREDFESWWSLFEAPDADELKAYDNHPL